MPYTYKTVEDLFWPKVNIKESDDCWEWNAGKFTYGYGCFKKNGKGMYAHRVAWELTNGPIPEGKLVLHKCDNRGCVNPNHLYIGTNSNNMQDRSERNPSGCGHGQPKLSIEDVRKIRKLLADKVPQRRIATMFKVHQGTISHINTSSLYPCEGGHYA